MKADQIKQQIEDLQKRRKADMTEANRLVRKRYQPEIKRLTKELSSQRRAENREVWKTARTQIVLSLKKLSDPIPGRSSLQEDIRGTLPVKLGTNEFYPSLQIRFCPFRGNYFDYFLWLRSEKGIYLRNDKTGRKHLSFKILEGELRLRQMDLPDRHTWRDSFNQARKQAIDDISEKIQKGWQPRNLHRYY